MVAKEEPRQETQEEQETTDEERKTKKAKVTTEGPFKRPGDVQVRKGTI